MTLRSLDELYVRCICGKKWTEHNHLGQTSTCQRYTPKIDSSYKIREPKRKK